MLSIIILSIFYNNRISAGLRVWKYRVGIYGKGKIITK